MSDVKARAAEWMQMVGCPNECQSWEPCELEPQYLISNPLNCTCGRVALVDELLRLSEPQSAEER